MRVEVEVEVGFGLVGLRVAEGWVGYRLVEMGWEWGLWLLWW